MILNPFTLQKIYLNKFKEALIRINNIFGDILYFDKLFLMFNFSFSREYLHEICFYRVFIKVYLKDSKQQNFV